MKKMQEAFVLDACIWPESGHFEGMTEDYKNSALDAVLFDR